MYVLIDTVTFPGPELYSLALLRLCHGLRVHAASVIILSTLKKSPDSRSSVMPWCTDCMVHCRVKLV